MTAGGRKELGNRAAIRSMLVVFLLASAMIGTERAAVAEPAPSTAGTAGGADWIDFTLPDASGKDVSLGRFIGKGPVLLAFWATWCPHCNESVPEINRMHGEAERYGGLRILALDFMESREKVTAFVSSKKVLYTVLLDRSGRVARKYKVVGIPTYILIDRNGKVAYRGHELPDPERHLR